MSEREINIRVTRTTTVSVLVKDEKEGIEAVRDMYLSGDGCAELGDAEFEVEDNSKKVMVQVEGEDGSELVELDIASATRLKQILSELMDAGEDYPEEANEIIGRGRRIEVFGIASTMGDGWGWYEPE